MSRRRRIRCRVDVYYCVYASMRASVCTDDGRRKRNRATEIVGGIHRMAPTSPVDLCSGVGGSSFPITSPAARHILPHPYRRLGYLTFSFYSSTTPRTHLTVVVVAIIIITCKNTRAHARRRVQTSESAGLHDTLYYYNAAVTTAAEEEDNRSHAGARSQDVLMSARASHCKRASCLQHMTIAATTHKHVLLSYP